MTPELMRVKIAKALGWRVNIRTDENTWFVYYPSSSGCGGAGCGFDMPVSDEYFLSVFNIANYPEDLNACHEMVGSLDRLKLQRFYAHLQDVCAIRKEGKAPLYLQSYELINATALQRCEAFLKTLNLYP